MNLEASFPIMLFSLLRCIEHALFTLRTVFAAYMNHLINSTLLFRIHWQVAVSIKQEKLRY